MSEFKQKILVGYSGHSYVVLETAKLMGIDIKSYMDINPNEINPFKLKYLGSEKENNLSYLSKKYQFILAIGDNKIRVSVADKLLSNSIEFINIIHPNSTISNSSFFGSGVFVSSNVIVNAFSQIDDFVILNTSCIIEHECLISRGVNVCPGAVICGNVKIGENSFIGANSVVKEGVTIGKNVIIGAGSVIIDNVPDNCTIVGNPGKII